MVGQVGPLITLCCPERERVSGIPIPEGIDKMPTDLAGTKTITRTGRLTNLTSYHVIYGGLYCTHNDVIERAV